MDVIIINTKKGKNGMERTNVSYSGYVAFDNILKKMDMATADDLRAYAKENGTNTCQRSRCKYKLAG